MGSIKENGERCLFHQGHIPEDEQLSRFIRESPATKKIFGRRYFESTTKYSIGDLKVVLQTNTNDEPVPGNGIQPSVALTLKILGVTIAYITPTLTSDQKRQCWFARHKVRRETLAMRE